MLKYVYAYIYIYTHMYILPDHRERGEIKTMVVKFESSDRVLEPAVRMGFRLLCKG